jgi:hypothetical protein
VRITDVTVVLHERSASGAASFGPAGRRIPLGADVDWDLINSSVVAVAA